MTQTTGIIMVLIAAFLWGSWLQATKYTKDFPLPTFMIWLYGSSFVIVLLFVSIANKFNLSPVIKNIYTSPWLALFVMVCGGLMAIGMQIQMDVIGRVGLVLSNSVSATCGVLLGTLVTGLVGGLPESISIVSLMGIAIILICATLICQYSGKIRDKKLMRESKKPLGTQDSKAALLLVFSSILVAFYPLGMSLGVKTNYSKSGFTSFGCILLLATGSFVGTLIYSCIILIRRKQMQSIFSKKYRKAIAISCLCGACHYGGNLIHVLAAPVMSVAVSWMIGRSGSLWTYLWGVYHKEYKGAGKKAYIVLLFGIALYGVGILLLSKSLYQ